jgi:broad specificity phosphatase PhoE
MRRLTLIRHALTAWNQDGRFQGHTDVPLERRGREQARRLGGRVADLAAPDVIVTSPAARARATAELAFPGRPVRFDPRLRELHFGVFEGRTMAQNQAHPAWAWWAADPYARPAPRGESYRALQARAVAWLDEAHRRWDGAHVVGVSHSGTVQMRLAHLFGVTQPRWDVRLDVAHTGIREIRFEAGLTVVERVNDARHLEHGWAGPAVDP